MQGKRLTACVTGGADGQDSLILWHQNLQIALRILGRSPVRCTLCWAALHYDTFAIKTLIRVHNQLFFAAGFWLLLELMSGTSIFWKCNLSGTSDKKYVRQVATIVVAG